MSYFAENKQNSTSLAMFASVGLHAVLFVSMAFFPATSETVKKPLRVVNLLPPGQLPTGTPSSQAKTSTLQDILNNPLPDLSAGLPPLGNTSEPPPNLADDTASSYLSDQPSGRVNTALNWTNPPNQPFSTNPPDSSPPSSTPPSKPSTPPPSSIEPAPSNVSPAAEAPILPDTLPPVEGAFPSPFPAGEAPSGSPASNGEVAIGALTPEPGEQIPASRQRVVPIISETVAFNYPEAACRDQLQGTVTVSYYRQPDGSYVPGSGIFENSSGYSILDDAALNAVIDAPSEGTGSYQRYSSRFDFLSSDAVCAGVNGSQPETVTDPSDQKASEVVPESQGDSKPEAKDSPLKESDSKSSGNDLNDLKEPDSPSSETPAPVQDEPKSDQTSDRTAPSPTLPTASPSAPKPTNTLPPASQPEIPANPGTASDLTPIEPIVPEPEPPQVPVAPAAPPPSLEQPAVESPPVDSPAVDPPAPAAPEPAPSESAQPEAE